MILKKHNDRNEWLAVNKNYMSSLAAEGVRKVVLASALYRQTAGRSEFQPCI
jgi:gluconate kinase